MKFYRLCRDPADPTGQSTYCPTLDQARHIVRALSMKTFHATAVVEEFEQPTDHRSILLLLNGAEPAWGRALRAWTVSPRGALVEMTDVELVEHNGSQA
jgi:hypothetical protein